MDYFLKFNDEAQALSILFTSKDGEPRPNFANIDVVGVIQAAPPEPIPEGYAPASIPGWHVNVRLMPGEDAAALTPYSVIPTNPRRIWG